MWKNLSAHHFVILYLTTSIAHPDLSDLSTCVLVQPEHLMWWLGIGIGVAVLIFQYIAQDLAAIRSGKQILVDT